jgi:hypothetical protein
MFDFIEGDLKEIKETVYEIKQNEMKPKLSPENIDKELEVLKFRYERKLITKKVDEEKIKELR